MNKKFALENNDNYLIGNFYWYSFIDSDVKVIYGFSIDENSYVCNDVIYYKNNEADKTTMILSIQ